MLCATVSLSKMQDILRDCTRCEDRQWLQVNHCRNVLIGYTKQNSLDKRRHGRMALAKTFLYLNCI